MLLEIRIQVGLPLLSGDTFARECLDIVVNIRQEDVQAAERTL